MLETLPMWSNVQPQLQPHPRCRKISKLGNHMERSRRIVGGFSNLVFAGQILYPAQRQTCLHAKRYARPMMGFDNASKRENPLRAQSKNQALHPHDARGV